MTYLLLHGAWHASWCWRKIKPLLEALGHTVITPNLPGHDANNQTPFSDITLQSYVDCVLDAIHPLNDPVVLVGHSMAGAVISQVAEYVPDKIAALIYIAAFMPAHQQSVSEQARNLSMPGTVNLSTEMIRDLAHHQIRLKLSQKLIDIFYGMCSEEDANDALSKLSAEPALPHTEKLTLSEQNWERVKKRYIICTQDKAISPDDQRKMAQAYVEDIVSIEADHSPFFSATDALVRALLV